MRRIASVLMVVAALLCAAALPAAAESVDPEPGPIRLTPPEAVGRVDAELLVQVPPGDFAAAWDESLSLARSAGGSVTTASTGLISEGGKRYSNGSFTVALPADRVDRLIGSIGGLGTVVSSDVRVIDAGRVTATVVASLTESPSAIPSVDAPEGRLGTALATAGDILVTMLSVAIVAAAVVVPLGLVALLGLALWRRLTDRPRVIEDAEPEREPIGV